jgi:hypothetical protein
MTCINAFALGQLLKYCELSILFIRYIIFILRNEKFINILTNFSHFIHFIKKNQIFKKDRYKSTN